MYVSVYVFKMVIECMSLAIPFTVHWTFLKLFVTVGWYFYNKMCLWIEFKGKVIKFCLLAGCVFGLEMFVQLHAKSLIQSMLDDTIGNDVDFRRLL